MTNEFYPPIIQVDNSGNIVKPISFQEAHSNALRHITINLFVFGAQDYKRILLQKRGKKTFRGEGKLDMSAGGHMHYLFDREGKLITPEETGYNILEKELFFNQKLPETLKLEQICTFSRDFEPDLEFTYLLGGVYPGPFSPNPEEVFEINFQDFDFVADDIKKQPEKYTRQFNLCIDAYLQHA